MLQIDMPHTHEAASVAPLKRSDNASFVTDVNIKDNGCKTAVAYPSTTKTFTTLTVGTSESPHFSCIGCQTSTVDLLSEILVLVMTWI